MGAARRAKWERRRRALAHEALNKKGAYLANFKKPEKITGKAK